MYNRPIWKPPPQPANENADNLGLVPEPSSVAVSISTPLLKMLVDVLDRHRCVVNQDTDGEREIASVITLMVSPRSDSAVTGARMASGTARDGADSSTI